MRPETTCRDCGDPIAHGVTPNGRRIPINPETRPRDDTYANVAVYRHSTGRIQARVLTTGERPELFEKRTVVHYATCAARQGSELAVAV